MKEIICLIICCTFTTALAKTPSWYTENVHEIRDKCIEETQLPYIIQQDMKNKPVDNPIVHKFVLCMAKGANVYSEDTGLNIDRLAYSFYHSNSKLNSNKSLIQDCVERNKEAVTDGEMIFKVISCVFYKEKEIRDRITAMDID